MGNVGWDSDADAIRLNAQEVLNSFCVDPSRVAQIVPITHWETGLGSGCEIFFVHHSDYQYVESRTKYSRKIVKPCSKPVYVSPKKTDQQRKLERAMRRLSECLRDAELERENVEQRVLEVKYKTKLMCAGKLVAFGKSSADCNDIVFTPHGISCFSEDLRSLALGYAHA